jgi:hypothetical protein
MLLLLNGIIAAVKTPSQATEATAIEFIRVTGNGAGVRLDTTNLKGDS